MTNAIQMPSNYVLMDAEEMEYLDGGLYLSNSALKNILVVFGTSASSVACITSAVKCSAWFVAAKLGSLLGPIGWAVSISLAAWIGKQAYTFAERTFCAIMRGKGVDFKIGWKWGCIPYLKGTLK